jgi:hypothetical protein
MGILFPKANPIGGLLGGRSAGKRGSTGECTWLVLIKKLSHATLNLISHDMWKNRAEKKRDQ